MEFTFRCRAGHTFRAQGEYSQFDMARQCQHAGCKEPAFMLVHQMAVYAGQTASLEREQYFEHNITYTGGSKEIQHRPNEQAMQCQCDGCRAHRRRAQVTEVAEPPRRNKRVAKEVRI